VRRYWNNLKDKGVKGYPPTGQADVDLCFVLQNTKKPKTKQNSSVQKHVRGRQVQIGPVKHQQGLFRSCVSVDVVIREEDNRYPEGTSQRSYESGVYRYESVGSVWSVIDKSLSVKRDIEVSNSFEKWQKSKVVKESDQRLNR